MASSVWMNDEDIFTKGCTQASYRAPGCIRRWLNYAHLSCYFTMGFLGITTAFCFLLGTVLQVIAAAQRLVETYAPAHHALVVVGSSLFALVASDYGTRLAVVSSRRSWAFQLIWGIGTLCALLGGLYDIVVYKERLLLELTIRCTEEMNVCDSARPVLDLGKACFCIMILANLLLIELCYARLCRCLDDFWISEEKLKLDDDEVSFQDWPHPHHEPAAQTPSLV